MKGFYYLCSENKGADQLRGHREADLRLCFRICKKLVFSRRGSYNIPYFSLINEPSHAKIAIKIFSMPCANNKGAEKHAAA